MVVKNGCLLGWDLMSWIIAQEPGYTAIIPLLSAKAVATLPFDDMK
jgi:hypothetical protein